MCPCTCPNVCPQGTHLQCATFCVRRIRSSSVELWRATLECLPEPTAKSSALCLQCLCAESESLKEFRCCDRYRQHTQHVTAVCLCAGNDLLAECARIIVLFNKHLNPNLQTTISETQCSQTSPGVSLAWQRLDVEICRTRLVGCQCLPC